MNYSSQCPVDIKKALSECGFFNSVACQAIAWRCLVYPQSDSCVEVIVWTTNGSTNHLACVEQRRSGWRIKCIKEPAFETEEEESKALRVLSSLKEDDYWIDVRFERQYDHRPTQEEVADFLAFAWLKMPHGGHVKWEGSRPLDGHREDGCETG